MYKIDCAENLASFQFSLYFCFSVCDNEFHCVRTHFHTNGFALSLALKQRLGNDLPCGTKQGSFLHEHARPLNKRCAWRLTTGSAFIKMARLKAVIAIILLVGLGECARDLIKCVVCKKNCNMVLTKAK